MEPHLARLPQIEAVSTGTKPGTVRFRSVRRMVRPAMSDLFLRKVTGHPQARDAYRVILKSEDGETEIGSIGTQFKAGPDPVWRWGIDTVIPMREIDSEGDGRHRKDCERQFKAAWEKFCRDPARLVEFLEMKRRRRG